MKTAFWHERRGLLVWCVMIGMAVGLAQRVEAKEGKSSPTATQSAAPTMTKEEMQAFLSKPLVARLATVRANGTPQVTPMWFLYEDGIVYMSTRPERAKVKHIKAHPQVAVVVDVMEAPLKNKVVIVEGTAEFINTGVKEMTTKIYQKYMGMDGAAAAPAQQSINSPRVILKITPKKVQTMDTTK